MKADETRKDPVRVALDQLFDEYRDRQVRMIRAERTIQELRADAAKLQAKIVALARVCDQEIEPESRLGKFLAETAAAGVTDGLRAVLQANGNWMTPTEIRTDLVRLGYDLTSYTNIMGSIHTVLKRLWEGEEVKRGLKKTEKLSVYRWARSEAALDGSVMEVYPAKAPASFNVALKRLKTASVKKDD